MANGGRSAGGWGLGLNLMKGMLLADEVRNDLGIFLHGKKGYREETAGQDGKTIPA